MYIRTSFFPVFLTLLFPSTSLSLHASGSGKGQFDGPAELPRVYVSSSLAETPSRGRIRSVNAGNNLQQAINDAACGDTIRLQAGATFTGRFVFPAKSCDDSHWITLRTSAPDSALPPEGRRLTPCYAGVNSLPGRPDFQCSSAENVLARLEFAAKGGSGPIVFAAGSNHYRFIGLEVTRAPGGAIYNLVSLEPKAAAHHLIFDRMWIHGTPQDETTRGVQFGGSSYVAVVDSFFSDFHCTAVSGACVDSQAIGGGSGDLPMGPYKIVNNFLEAGAEDVIFGGGPASLSPADIEVRRNHMFRPLNWQPGHPEFIGARDGHPFIVKNDFELKNAQRVLLEGNILENSWGGFSQRGFAVLLTPKNQSPNVCPLCRVTDVIIRYNRILHMGNGFQIANVLSDTGGASSDGGRYSIHDNILGDIDGAAYKGGGNFAQISGWAPALHDVTIDHNTGFAPNALLNVGAQAAGPRISNFVFTNNLVSAGAHGIISTGGRSNCAFQPERQGPAGVLASCFESYKFNHNCIIGASGFPKENIGLKDLNAADFASLRQGKIVDHHLRAGSRCKNAGTEGKDLGADVDEVEKATAGVL
jgi:hypothetical protein